MRIRTKRRICIALGLSCWLAMICTVGGAEQGWMPVPRAGMLAVASELVGAALLWKAGWIRWRG